MGLQDALFLFSSGGEYSRIYRWDVSRAMDSGVEPFRLGWSGFRVGCSRSSMFFFVILWFRAEIEVVTVVCRMLRCLKFLNDVSEGLRLLGKCGTPVHSLTCGFCLMVILLFYAVVYE